VPGRRQRAGLGLAVADDAGDDEIRIVEGGAEGVRQRVAEEVVALGDAVNANIACVTPFMCHRDEATAIARGAQRLCNKHCEGYQCPCHDHCDDEDSDSDSDSDSDKDKACDGANSDSQKRGDHCQ